MPFLITFLQNFTNVPLDPATEQGKAEYEKLKQRFLIIAGAALLLIGAGIFTLNKKSMGNKYRTEQLSPVKWQQSLHVTAVSSIPAVFNYTSASLQPLSLL